MLGKTLRKVGEQIGENFTLSPLGSKDLSQHNPPGIGFHGMNPTQSRAGTRSDAWRRGTVGHRQLPLRVGVESGKNSHGPA
jgi:hypothetical protein